MSEEDVQVIYSRFITLKNGRVLDAHAYGRKVWRFKVPKRSK